MPDTAKLLNVLFKLDEQEMNQAGQSHNLCWVKTRPQFFFPASKLSFTFIHSEQERKFRVTFLAANFLAGLAAGRTFPGVCET